ncbi:MAG: cysteine rich repeat-containing protein, partial [Syntrophales bacterium LBB04]|nr:cysteine rich repeat-containing protein [Syntrophales bacterium LBB04]
HRSPVPAHERHLRHLQVEAQMKKRTAVILFLAAALVLPATTADASRQFRKNCKKEIEKFWKDIKPGEGKVIECLLSNEKKLSDTCKSELNGINENSREFRSACKDDMGKLCGDVKPGKGKIITCLRSKKDDLSMDCSEYLGVK